MSKHDDGFNPGDRWIEKSTGIIYRVDCLGPDNTEVALRELNTKVGRLVKVLEVQAKYRRIHD